MLARKFTFFFLLAFVFAPVWAQNGLSTVVICWDTSKSMEVRAIEEEMSYLEKLFKEKKETRVQLLLFGMDVKERTYQIRQGNWSKLKTDLQNVDYEGAAFYSALNPKIENRKVYLFTDGLQLLKKDYLLLGEGSIILNSSPKGNRKFLNRTALLNRSEFQDLVSEQSVTRVEEEEVQIRGTVFVDNERLANIPVRVKGSDRVVYTDKQGEYVIPEGIEGDSIIVNNDFTFAIRDIQDRELFLKSRITQLDEVVLTENKKVSEVSKEEEGTGYAVQSIGKEELTTVNTNLNSAVRGRFSGVTTGGGIQSGADQDLSRFIVRGQSSMLLNNYGLIVVDGVPIKQSNSASSNFQGGDAIASTNFIDPALIEDITVLKGLAATNRFGSLGSNGVLLITTKTAVTKGKNGEIVDRARLTDNIYDENEALAKPQEAPFYQLLKAAQNPQEAYQTYSSLQELNQGNIAFYLESYDYFSKQNKSLSISVLTNILEYYPEDIKLLRTVEFYLSQAGYDQQARLVNDQILEISPNNLHAYYKRVMLPDDKAVQTQMETKYALLKGKKKFKEINAQPIQKTLVRDIKNYIEKNRAALNVNSIDSYLANNIRYDARFVFEWNNPEAEFELQFVNPQDRYYNWGYSRNEDAQRVNLGLTNGYMLEEFEFYGKESIGKWIVNVKYLGNISEVDQTPLVLKCVVYTDFGKPTEQKKEVVVHLSKRHQKQNVLEIVVN